MASYNELLALIDAYINQNGVQAITGQVLNGVLRAMVDQLGRGYSIMGAADPTTDPGTPDGPETWFASVPGTYTNFDGIQIVDGELALLSYVPSTGFSKNTIYEGFQTVQATIDGNVGTPAVGVSYANGILSFDFHNMKGVTGDPAGFGAVTASVDSNIGTPSVQVQTSGPDTAKNIVFAFRNLKGETGVTSVVATVDNTVGSPSCAVSLVGQELHLDFTGLKGAQGDTGVSADYPITIANNLTTNDPTAALSAAMGVQLESEITQLDLKVGELDEELHNINPHITGRMGMANNNEDVTVTDLLEYTGQYGVVTITSGSDGYLWCCLENDHFRVTSSGVEIPMVYVKEEGSLHCYVSAEKIKAGVFQFVVEGIHPIKADTERVIITARSYTITYGDAIPEFGFIADAEVEGTPSITCEAVQGSDVGTYAIVISRGTVEDDNAIYVNGTLTIVKAELTITAENKQVEVGGTMPTFTVQYSGFVLDDDASDLITQPTCTTNAQDTSTEGFYTITPSGAVSGNYTFVYVDGELQIGNPSIVSFSVEQIDASGSCGGYLVTADGKFLTSSTYFGILIDVRNYRGKRLVFTKNTTTGDWANVRFAFLKSATLTNNVKPTYSSEAGFTGVVTQAYPEGGTLEYTIPSDASYLFLYTYSNGYNSRASNVAIYGSRPQNEAKNLYASLFTRNTTIGGDGTVYTGPNQNVVCSDYLDAAIYAYCGNLQVIVNSLPSNVSLINMNVAEYDGNKKFIRRDTYAGLPSTFTLAPSCAFVRLMAVQKDHNNNILPGDVAYFDGDDIQSIGTNN